MIIALSVFQCRYDYPLLKKRKRKKKGTWTNCPGKVYSIDLMTEKKTHHHTQLFAVRSKCIKLYNININKVQGKKPKS